MATLPTSEDGRPPIPGISPALEAALARNWWAIAIRGVLGVLFGVIAFAWPGATMLSLVLLFSAYMLVDGVMAIVSAVGAARHGQRWGLLTFEGIVNILTGVAAFLWPGLTVVVFVTLVAAWAIISGALMLAAAFKLGADHGRWWIALGGIASIIFGALLIIAPILGAVVLTWWIGAYAIVFGIMLLVAAFKLRQRAPDHGGGPSTATPAQSA
jgi:uncharacterized membrane protein HdeD (DUF308 family)